MEDINTPEWDVICDALESADIAMQQAARDVYDGRLTPDQARDRMHAIIDTLTEGAACES